MPETKGPYQARLLVAAPRLLDPNFARSVVLVVAHSDQGAVGLVLNRPTMTRVSSPLPEWEDLASAPAVVFVGGPVSEGSICLAQVKPQVSVPDSGYLPLQGALGTIDLEADPAFVSPCIDKLRIFAGYGGWGPGQLEAEIAEDAWFVVDAQEGDAFSDDPSGLWSRVLRRQGGQLAVLSFFPPDPSLQ